MLDVGTFVLIGAIGAGVPAGWDGVQDSSNNIRAMVTQTKPLIKHFFIANSSLRRPEHAPLKSPVSPTCLYLPVKKLPYLIRDELE